MILQLILIKIVKKEVSERVKLDFKMRNDPNIFVSGDPKEFGDFMDSLRKLGYNCKLTLITTLEFDERCLSYVDTHIILSKERISENDMCTDDELLNYTEGKILLLKGFFIMPFSTLLLYLIED